MNSVSSGWFTENNEIWPGTRFSLQIESVLHEEKSSYQNIKILQTKMHGKMLVLDNIIQCTEFDEFSYQEMISHLPLCSHPNPRKVLVVGGGDGGVAREVCKHTTVEEVVQVEIDNRVIELCKRYLPTMAIGLSNPKVRLVVEDGFNFMEKHRQEFDVIITDSSDPIGPAIPLFQKKYFELMENALRPGGIICSQAGTVWTNAETLVHTYNACKEVFPLTAYGFTSVPTYPTGQIGFVLGCLDQEINVKNPLKIFSKNEELEMDLKYYTSEIHRAAFILPKFVQELLLNGK